MMRESERLELGCQSYQVLRKQGLVLIDLDGVEDSIISGDAGHALYELMDQYRSQEVLDSKKIALFQRAMAGWVLAAGAAGAVSRMPTPETILEVGADGGSVRIIGNSVDGEWRFRLETNESALADEDEDDNPATPAMWFNTWRAVLKALDKYPWPNLYPLSVHPDFRQKIASALKARLGADDQQAWQSWGNLLRPISR